MRNKVVTQFSVAVLRYAKEEKKNIFDAFPGVSVKKKKVLKTVFAELWRTIKKKPKKNTPMNYISFCCMVTLKKGYTQLLKS